MNIEFADREPKLVTGIEHLAPGRVFLWDGALLIVTDEGDAVNLVSGFTWSYTHFEDQEVEVIPAEDVTVVVKR